MRNLRVREVFVLQGTSSHACEFRRGQFFSGPGYVSGILFKEQLVYNMHLVNRRQLTHYFHVEGQEAVP